MRLKVVDLERGTEKEVDFGDKVVVGRSPDVDLQILHCAVSRRHAELVLDTKDDVEVLRFKTISKRSACVIRGRPCQEGVLKADDPLGIGPIAVALQRTGGIPRKRLILYLIAAVWFAILVWKIPAGDERPVQKRQPLELSPPMVTVSCTTTCEAQALDAHATAMNYVASPQDPINNYRAVLDFTRAEEFARLAGRPIRELAELPTEKAAAWRALYEKFKAAHLGYKLATEAKPPDWQSANEHADRLLKLVPADHSLHPRLEQMKRLAETRTTGGRN